MRPILFALLLVASACQQPMNAAPRGEGGDPGAGTLTEAGAMHSARAAHTATALPDGRVLLAGGFTGDASRSAELFDPASDAFTRAGAMQTPRQSHTATLLPDGRVLLTGGYDADNAYLASAEIYDPASDTFALAGAMTEARAGHVAVSLEDGRVLLIGGVGTGWTFLASAEVYDPETGTFTATGAMGVPRESHAVVRLPDGRVWVVGGHRGRRADIELYASAEVYDPETGAFAPAGEMTRRRHKHDATLLPDGRVLITGGTDERDYHGRYTDAEVYDPRTGASTPIGEMQGPRYKHAGTTLVLADGRVLLAGGAPQAEVYDPESSTFHLVGGDARMVGQFSATALLPDGRVLVTGGYGEGRGAQPTAWIYTP